jgi:hypothetical protein
MKHLSAILALTILLAVGLACSESGNASESSPGATNASGSSKSDETKTESGISIESVILTNDGGDAVTNFKPSDNPQRAVVKLSEIESGTRVKAVWTAVNAGGEKNQKILEKEVETDSMMNQANFSLSLPNPFPTGDYKVEIYLNGKLSKTVNYKVQ